ncbi:MAG: hypothetical protein ACE5FL_03745 [Myxococcota bacterium]
MDRRGRVTAFARAARLAATALAFGCGGDAVPDWDIVEIEVPGASLEAAADRPLRTVMRSGGRERDVRLVSRPSGDPSGRAFDVGDADGAPLGRLLLAPSHAALLYHLASRDPGLPEGAFLDHRLAVVTAAGGAELGILVAEGSAAEAATASIAALPIEAGASLLALGQALGAWDLLVRDRHPRDGAGRPRLSFFVPRAPGDWRALSQRSPEAFLPPALARRLAASPDFRRRHDAFLVEYARRLPVLAAAAQRFADTGTRADVSEAVATLDTQLGETREALLGYFDSVWIDLVVEGRPPDAARLRIDVYSVSDLTLEVLTVAMSREFLVVVNENLSALRLLPSGGSPAIPGRLVRDRLEFTLGIDIAPRTTYPERFAGVRFEFDLVGLAPLDDDYWRLLDQLELHATNRITGEDVAANHITRLVGHADPRFGIGSAETADDLAASLRTLLIRPDGSPAPFDLDVPARTLRLAAGRFVVSGDLLLPDGFGLVLGAGVELWMREKRSILVRGPLEVRGRAEAPVRIRGVSDEAAWGVLAVQGRGRSTLGDRPRPRSTIRYLELSGGSEDALKGVTYSGQLSVHHQDLVLEHVTLSGARADDALNVKYGTAEIRDSVFVDNASDAVDLDWTDASIRGCLFARGGSGGDAVDVSGARVVVLDSVFREFRDKCVSVGEASTLELRGALLWECRIGVASKDLSTATVTQSVFVGNGRNFSAYQKKQIFGGGTLRADDVVLIDAAEPDRRDALSELSVAGVRTAAAGADELGAAESFSRQRYREITQPPP